ncbi:MAG: IS66 family insertion sequence element accessory protein TnpB [Pseudomonadales bacterium]|jgi:transposase|nr:IS66 family insertion sequence element accessory protein TnpB [Pseudomonadales bacterium]|tara:strand:- start:1755 stop:2111 length:357 start_codon:yes stop_codon:yes gene_type:complete
MRPDPHLPEVFLHRQPVDFRKSINGLAVIVEQGMQHSPFSKQLYVFINKRRNRLKILFWEDNGFCLYYKRLEQKQFHWPKLLEEDIVTLTGQQLNWLLDGFNLNYLMADVPQQYTAVT